MLSGNLQPAPPFLICPGSWRLPDKVIGSPPAHVSCFHWRSRGRETWVSVEQSGEFVPSGHWRRDEGGCPESFSPGLSRLEF